MERIKLIILNKWIVWKSLFHRFSYIFFILFFPLINTPSAYCGSWNILWQEDFGVVEDSVCRDFADPNMSVPGHKVADVDHLQDGYYGITNSTYWAFIHKKSVNPNKAYHFVPGRDHTGNMNGGMLVVNVGGSGLGENIYENKLKLNICGDHKYRLIMYVANVSDAPLSPSLTLKVFNEKDPDNPILLESESLSGSQVVAWPGSEKNSEGLYIHKEREWSEASVEFEAQEGDELKIVITNNCSWGNGNDFALDDIILQRYDEDELPQPQIDVNNDLTKLSCIPTYSINNVSLLDSWKSLYDNVYFLWQYSTDDGYTWTIIPEESGIDKTDLHREFPSENNEVYRLIITGGSSEQVAKEKAEEISQNGSLTDGCDYFSISNIISQVVQHKIPHAFLGIDGDKNKTIQSAYDCGLESHYINLFSSEWSDKFSDFSMLWQYSYDEQTWISLNNSNTDLLFTDEFDGLTYFRVVLSDKMETIEEFIANGSIDDCSKDFVITNKVSIECKTPCKTPECEGLSDTIEICDDSNIKVEWKVRKTNDADVSDIKWYKKTSADAEWILIDDETGESILVDNPQTSTSYLFLASDRECISDSIKFELIVHESILIAPLLDTIVCDGQSINYEIKVVKGSPHTAIWNGVPNKQFTLSYNSYNTKPIVTLSVTDSVCTSNEVSSRITVETPVTVTLNVDPAIVCEGESVELTANAILSEFNSLKWKKDGNDINETGKSFIANPTEDATYSFIVSGKKCENVEKSVNIKVEKKVDIELLPLPDTICEGQSVDLSANVSLASVNTFKWTKDNHQTLSERDLSIRDIVDNNAEYKFTVYGNKCQPTEVFKKINVLRKPILTLSVDKDVVCENESVELTLKSNRPLVGDLMIKSESDNQYKKTNEMSISDNDVTINEVLKSSSTFKFVTTDEQICDNVESNEIKSTVITPVEVSLDSVPSLICEGSKMNLKATINSTVSDYGWKKNADDSFARNKLEAEDTPSSLTAYEFWASNTVCPDFSQQFVVDILPTKNVDLEVSQTRICKDSSVLLKTSYSKADEIVWEKKLANNSQFEKIDSGRTEITVTPKENTIFRVSAISDHGCTNNGSEIEVSVSEHIGLSIDDVIVCEGEIVHIQADSKTKVDRFLWNISGDIISSNERNYDITPDSSILVKVTAFNDVCEETVIANVEVVRAPQITSHEEITDRIYQMLTDVNYEILYYDYHNGVGKTTSNIIENVKQGKIYNVEVSNEQGCASTYKFTVPIADLEFPRYFYQGEENWKIKNLDVYSTSTLRIYDRYSKLIFSADNAIEGWDGNYNGHAMPSTDYWFVLDLPEIDKQYTGHFTLMRK